MSHHHCAEKDAQGSQLAKYGNCFKSYRRNSFGISYKVGLTSGRLTGFSGAKISLELSNNFDQLLRSCGTHGHQLPLDLGIPDSGHDLICHPGF